MTMEQVLIVLFVFIGILMCIFAVVGVLFWGLILPFAVLLFIGGVAVIILTIVIGFILI